MRKHIYLLFIFFLYSMFSYANEDAGQIITSSALFGNAPNIVMELKMIINTGRGTKERELQFYLTQEPGSEASKMLLQITSPGFLSRMKFLTVRDNNGQEQKWIRTSHGVRKIAAGGGNEPIFDSDFTAEDLSGITPDDFDLSLGQESSIQGRKCFKIIAISRISSATYSKKVFYIDKSSRLLMRLEYYNGDTMLKEYNVEDTIRKNETDFPARGVMTNHQEGTSTILEINNIELPSSIPSRKFNRGSL